MDPLDNLRRPWLLERKGSFQTGKSSEEGQTGGPLSTPLSSPGEPPFLELVPCVRSLSDAFMAKPH